MAGRSKAVGSEQRKSRGPGRRFQTGKSGNPGGRPKEIKEVRDLARQYTEAAVVRLAYWLESNNPKASVAACSALLDRAWGKPAQAVTGEGGEGPVRIVATFEWPSQNAA